jgi:hypothetical protein
MERWRKEIKKFDRNVNIEERNNKRAIEEYSKNNGRPDGGNDDIYSVNSLSGDPKLERELKEWRKALRSLQR